MVNPSKICQGIRIHIAIDVALLCTAFIGVSGAQGAAQQVVAGPSASRLCVACHGIDGDSFKPNYPKLAGQSRTYLVQQLIDFQEGRRKDPNMSVIAAGLSKDDVIAVANFFSTRGRSPAAVASSPETVPIEPDKAAITTAPCLACHHSNTTDPNRPPYIAGQQYHYLAKQLREFKGGKRVDADRVMARISAALTDADITTVAEYLARLPR